MDIPGVEGGISGREEGVRWISSKENCDRREEFRWDVNRLYDKSFFKRAVFLDSREIA